MARKQSRVLLQQKIAAASLAAIVLVVAAYLFWMTVDDATQGEFIEGEHYLLIDNPRRIRSDKIEVMEFFSYACVHCYNFDPILKEWVEEKGDAINFIQTPAVANEYWRLLGQNFLTYQELDEQDKYHTAFFRALHDGSRLFSDEESLAEFYEQQGGDKQTYIDAYNSIEVASELSWADAMARRMRVSAVPAIIIQGKYLVRTSGSVGPKRMLEVMDYLLAMEESDRMVMSIDQEPQGEVQEN